jgi:hypothetical protein
MQVVGEVLAAAFVLSDLRDTVERLFAGGNAHDRVSSVLASLTSTHRLTGGDVVRLAEEERRDYPPRARTSLPDVDQPARGTQSPRPETEASSDGPPAVDRHRAVKIQSVIDIHSWDQARWTGTLYASYGSEVPPVLALTFRNVAGARRIFERWRERFGPKDLKHEISLSVIRGLPGHPPSHYAVQITSGLPEGEDYSRDALYQIVSRVLVMEPSDNRHLERFLALRRAFGCYLLAPAVIADGEPETLADLTILKRDISVVQASEVTPDDIQHAALEMVARQDAGQSDK